MNYARMKRHILIGSLILIIALACGSSAPLGSTLSTGVRHRLAIQLALATTPSHDPRQPAGSLCGGRQRSIARWVSARVRLRASILVWLDSCRLM